MERADEVNARLTRLWNGRNKRNVVETLHVQFAFDRSDLSGGAQTALLGIVGELKTNPDLTSVRRYLIENGADLARIHSVGLGPLQASDEHAKLRRVTVRVMVNPTD